MQPSAQFIFPRNFALTLLSTETARSCVLTISHRAAPKKRLKKASEDEDMKVDGDVKLDSLLADDAPLGAQSSPVNPTQIATKSEVVTKESPAAPEIKAENAARGDTFDGHFMPKTYAL
jgi:hypothetical protein